jgi:hypothetical protein
MVHRSILASCEQVSGEADPILVDVAWEEEDKKADVESLEVLRNMEQVGRWI